MSVRQWEAEFEADREQRDKYSDLGRPLEEVCVVQGMNHKHRPPRRTKDDAGSQVKHGGAQRQTFQEGPGKHQRDQQQTDDHGPSREAHRGNTSGAGRMVALISVDRQRMRADWSEVITELSVSNTAVHCAE